MTTNDIIVGQLYTHRGIDATFGEGILYLGCGTFDHDKEEFVDKFLIVARSIPLVHTEPCATPGTKVTPESAFWLKFQPYNPKADDSQQEENPKP